MPFYQKDRKDAGGTGGVGGPTGNKPWENPPSGGGGGGSPSSPPTSPAPEGYEWRWQSDPNNPQKGWWILAAAAVGAIGSYLSARQANKPRSGYTDQTTTQTPYMSDTIRPDIEAILNFQRQLINQGPNYVGDRRFWPTSPVAPQPGYAPPRMERTDERNARTRADFEAWRAGGGRVDRDTLVDVTGGGTGRHEELDIPRGGGGGAIRDDPYGRPSWEFGGIDKAGVGAPTTQATPPTRMFGGWTAEELENDPSRVGKLGEPGLRKYNRYRRRQGQMGDLSYLRSVFASTGRG